MKNEVDYIKPILITDKPKIYVTTESIGTKSFTLGYKVMVNDELYTTGKSVLVSFDANKNQTIKIPDQMLEALKQLK